MIETVQAFIRSVYERKHVLLLIENMTLTVEFKLQDETISLFLNNGDVTLADETSHYSAKCCIQGQKSKVEDLITGRKKLRTLLIQGELKCFAPFRTILLLESFFYLGKTMTLVTKIS
jgi:hypothetical protein